jgi:hypothetical protein
MKALSLPYGLAIFVGSLLLANEERRYDAQAALHGTQGKG